MTVMFDPMVKIYNAYREGKARTAFVYVEDQTQAHFQQFQEWHYDFSPAEKAVMEIHSGLIRKIVQAVHQKELTYAAELIRSDEGVIYSGHLSPDVQCLCKSYLEAAYLDYKYQRYDEAIARLREALAIDILVEERNHALAFVLHAHRIMLLDNWVRVLAHRQQYKEATSLAFQTLDYLEQKIQTFSCPTLADVSTSWDSSKLAVYSPDSLSILFRAVTMQVVEYATGTDVLESPEGPIDLHDLLMSNAHHHSAAEKCYLSIASHNWIHMKQALFADDSSRFLDLAAEILAAGPGKWPALWYATVVETLVFNRRHQDMHAIPFQQEVEKDASSWKRLPLAWKALIYTV